MKVSNIKAALKTRFVNLEGAANQLGLSLEQLNALLNDKHTVFGFREDVEKRIQIARWLGKSFAEVFPAYASQLPARTEVEMLQLAKDFLATPEKWLKSFNSGVRLVQSNGDYTFYGALNEAATEGQLVIPAMTRKLLYNRFVFSFLLISNCQAECNLFEWVDSLSHKELMSAFDRAAKVLKAASLEDTP